MSDERVERVEAELRAWLELHTERHVPDSIREFLATLPSSDPDLDRVAKPRLTQGQILRRRGALRALAAAAVIVALAAGLGYGLSQRSGPPASAPPASPLPRSSTQPSGPATTTVIEAGLVDVDHGWALTHDDLVWTDDGGTTWTSIRPAGVVPSAIHAVHFLDPGTGWIVWLSPDASPMTPTVERTTDGGRTWRATHIPDAYPDGVGGVTIQAIDGGTVWIQVETVHSSASSIGGLYLSHDGGVSWVPGTTIPGGWPIRFASATNGWTTARPLRDELDATTDGGLTWRKVTITLPPGHERDGMSFDLPTFTGDVGIPQTGVLPVTLYAPPDPSSGGEQAATLALYTTDDGGATWRFATAVGTTKALGLGVTIASAIVDQQTWLVASVPEHSALSKTTDGGRTWTDIGSNGLSGFSDTLQFVDGASGWALTQAEGSDFLLSSTRDGGRTWRLLDPVARPTATPSPASSAAPGPYHWNLVSSEGDLATYSVAQAIRRRDDTYLAIASGQDVRVLTFADGRAWTIEAADPGLLAAAADHLTLVAAVVEGNDRLVAVGSTALFDISSGDARAWTSSGGIRWTAAAPATGMTDAAMEAVVVGPDGFVAVGSDGFPGGNVQLPGARGAASWTSVDGTRWTRTPNQASFAGAIMTGVLRNSSGYVAWGQIIPNVIQGAPLPPIWTSSDGIHWDRAKGITDAGGPGDPLSSILAIGDRLVAVGARRLPDDLGGQSVPAAWTSTDGGQTWKAAVVGTPAEAQRSGAMSDVAAAKSGLVAIGRFEPPAGQVGGGSAVVWRSSDEGRTWTTLPGDPSFAGASLEQIIARDAGFIVFGQVDDPNAYANVALIWVAEPSP